MIYFQKGNGYAISNPFDIGVWDLRVEALERKLDNREFARVLIHLVQRRDFKQTERV